MRSFVRMVATFLLSVGAVATMLVSAPAADASASLRPTTNQQLSSQHTSYGAGSHATRHPPADWWL
jgi:type II secretory pathway component PulK